MIRGRKGVPGYDRTMMLLRSLALPLVLIMVVAVAGCGGAGPDGTARSSTTPVDPATPPVDPATPPVDPVVLTLDLQVVVGGLRSPLDVAIRPGDPGSMLIVEQAGRVRVVRDAALIDEPFLDIAGTVTSGGEQGLLGLAVHPDPADGRVFVYYTSLDGSQVVSSFRTDPADPERALGDSERVLLTMEDPFGNHNGGGLAFGPDGYLYVSTGDGGGGGDPLGSGRRLDTLLAKILRLDVDLEADSDQAYGIPADNPFVSRAGALPEIWLTGLRNPFRIRFDGTTGDLWIGDVGQSEWEEIDRAPAGIGGLDFGWNVMEGFHCFAGDGCAQDGLTPPVAEYGHDLGCSVTGGDVYRGTTQPALAGKYVFADYCSGRFWVLDADADGRQEPTIVMESNRSISSIARGPDGELYATDLGSGELLHIVVGGS